MDLRIDKELSQLFIAPGEARLDAAVAGKFKDAVRPYLTHCETDVLLDLSAVDFLDSSGLGAIMALYKAMPDGLQMRLQGLRPNVERVFKLTRMDQIFTILPDSSDGA